MKNNANPNYKDVNGWTALRFAVRNNKIDIVKLLVEHKAEVDVKANDKATPFASSIGKGFTEIAEYLIKNGANINNIDKDNDTPLMYCAQSGNLATVKFLLQYEPDLTIKNNSGKTALNIAKEKNHTEIIKLLQ